MHSTDYVVRYHTVLYYNISTIKERRNYGIPKKEYCTVLLKKLGVLFF